MGKHTYGRLAIIIILMLATLACASLGKLTPTSTPEPMREFKPQKTSQPRATPAPVEPKPTGTPSPTPLPPTPTLLPPTHTAVPLGINRQNPYPITELVRALNWDIQVLETLRGEQAWAQIREANQFNSAPPEGMEYLLVKIHATCTYTDRDVHSIGKGDFDVTGDYYVRYPSAYQVDPDPQLSADLIRGKDTEGWVSFLVGQGESNLMLIFDELADYDIKRQRFIALDTDATLDVPADNISFAMSEAGMTSDDPAVFGEAVTTSDLQIRFNEMVRGEQAWQTILETNRYNDPPEAGMEYVLIRVTVRNISTVDSSIPIDSYVFTTQSDDGTTWDSPSIVDPNPALNFDLYPGGQADGWITVQVAQDATGIMAVYRPFLAFSDENVRYLSLEPHQ